MLVIISHTLDATRVGGYVYMYIYIYILLKAPASSDFAGQEGAVTVKTLMSSDSATFGFNAQSGEFVDMIEAGIIDPTKVVSIYKYIYIYI